ncbi:MAG TPA: hypothetical protein VKU44_04925 [Terriglobia bacterium]|nr:hypothetical protein [Terriglobia bacterium]
MRQLADQAAAKRASAEAIQDQVVVYADRLNLPVGWDGVRVDVGNGKVGIRLEYSVPVDLKV